MTEQDIYKNVLANIIDRTEKLQINNSQELVRNLIHELENHQMPKS
ncbi:hypothetical protein [Aquibacillus rhizosphaerae]|uniref:Uncharacterized protein n=1 Tax=Aquibacillus rhizosphaerae TaxID=3051431 RepID=A0ABT7L071_9BACI|nr:hypothetical protein [Aquibacillus sp. LR5S19]MDL4839208.1 hypothetical protein [Aquibacillus sp. LR5S19]